MRRSGKTPAEVPVIDEPGMAERFQRGLQRAFMMPARHRVQSKPATQVYRLDPIPTTFGDPRWQLSNVQKTVWVRAENPDKARSKVASATLMARRPTKVHEPIPQSPWLGEPLALCAMDTARNDVPDDAVITADGRSVADL
jgi:hypothetical protein